MEEILKKIREIKPINVEARSKAIERQDKLAKPPHSLGVLEDLSVRLAGITGKVFNKMEKMKLFVFAADNGVVSEGVSMTPQVVTYNQTINLTKHLTGASVLCKEFGCDITVVDVGVIGDTSHVNGIETKVIQRKIRESTSNIRIGPAMSREECLKAIEIGFNAAVKNAALYDAFGIGEMGIGNTTTSSAVLSVLLDLPVEEVTGKGAGLTESGYLNKINVIKDAINVNKPNKDDVIDVLSKVGGFDLASMTGCYLGCAYMRKPVIIDGFISVVAALCAARLNKNSKDYFFASHKSFEIGYVKAVEELGLTPLFDLKMRLGEGSGCPIAFEVLRAACSIINNMATFDEASIDDDYVEDLIVGDKFTV